mmetsp:Transcript_49003/g.127911  ORF Transcript_49003/g.127911 Transcript_49003/m.127911 type:complete len:215 (-) Transcript_49003:586-1230(-)
MLPQRAIWFDELAVDEIHLGLRRWGARETVHARESVQLSIALLCEGAVVAAVKPVIHAKDGPLAPDRDYGEEDDEAKHHHTNRRTQSQHHEHRVEANKEVEDPITQPLIRTRVVWHILELDEVHRLVRGRTWEGTARQTVCVCELGRAQERAGFICEPMRAIRTSFGDEGACSDVDVSQVRRAIALRVTGLQAIAHLLDDHLHELTEVELVAAL